MEKSEDVIKFGPGAAINVRYMDEWYELDQLMSSNKKQPIKDSDGNYFYLTQEVKDDLLEFLK